MGQELYQRGLRVPVVQAPTIQRVDVSSGLQAAADAGYETEGMLERKAREDAAVWAGMQSAKARSEWLQRVRDARDKGEVADGFKDQIETEFKTYQDETIAAAPAFAKDAMRIHLTNIGSDLGNAALDAESDMRITRRTGQAEQMLNSWGNIIATDPSQFKKGWEQSGAVLGGLQLPTEVKQKLEIARRGLASQAISKMSETDPGRVIRELDAGQWNEYLDADDRKGLYNSAQREQKQRISEAKAKAAVARAENFQDAADLAQSDLLARRMTGKGVDAKGLATIRAGFTDKQWEKYQSTAAKMDATFKVTGDMRSQSYAEIQQTLQKSKPSLAADGTAPADYADQVAAHNEAQKIAADILNDRKNDPASAARDAFPDVTLAWQQQNDNPSDPGHLRVAIRKTLAAQSAMGIAADKQKPLPAQMAASIAGEIRGAPPDRAAQLLQDTAAKFGADWRKVYSQIAPQLDANSAVAATLSPNMAAVLLEASRTAGASGKAGSGVDELRKSLGVPASGVGSATAIIAEDEDFKDFRRAMFFKGQGGTVGVKWAEGTETLAVALKARNGISIEEATQTAIKETVTSKYNFGRVNSVPFVTPKHVDAGAAEASARQIMQTFKGDDVDLPRPLDGAVPVADTRGAYVDAIRRDGYWITTTGNKGLELWVGGAPVTHKGQRITRTWDQLSDVSIAPPTNSYGAAKVGK